MSETPAQPAGQNPDVGWALDDLNQRAKALKRRRDYYEGRHVSVIPPGKTLSPLLQELLEDLVDNLCDDVVDEPVARLSITNWTDPSMADTADLPDDDTEDTPGTPPAPEQVNRGELAQDLWDTNRGQTRANATHRDGWRSGDAWNIVERAKDGTVRWFPQRPECMAARYQEDNPDTLDVVAKVWKSGRAYRMNLYYGPDSAGGGRLERWASAGSSHDGGAPQAKAFVQMTSTTDDGTRDWPRIPVFHFPADEVGGYGRSVLTDVIPLQDLLNKSVADLVVAMEDVALPQRYGTGIQTSYEPDGTETPLRRRARSAADMLTTASKDAAFGQFPGADMSQFLSVQTAWRLEIARKGYLPAYSVAGPTGSSSTPASGLSMLVQEGRLLKRCKNAQEDWGWVWTEQMAYMLTLSGTPTVPADLDLEWAPIATRDETALWELLTLKSGLGVPKRQVLMEGGYDQDQVDDWLDAEATAPGGRLGFPGTGIGGVASITMPGVSGGVAVPADALLPPQPVGAQAPAA